MRGSHGQEHPLAALPAVGESGLVPTDKLVIRRTIILGNQEKISQCIQHKLLSPCRISMKHAEPQVHTQELRLCDHEQWGTILNNTVQCLEYSKCALKAPVKGPRPVISQERGRDDSFYQKELNHGSFDKTKATVPGQLEWT